LNLVLRSYWRSSCSWRVRIALNLKNLTYDIVPVHLIADGGQQHSNTHSQLNPMRELPVLLVGNEPIAQSMAILEYLEETQPHPPLFPTASLDRARVRQMAEVINSGIQPVQNLRVTKKLGQDFEISKAAQQTWSRDWIMFGFSALNKLVESYGGKCCFGDDITIADLCLIPQIYNARRFEVDLSRYQQLVEIDERLATHPAFFKAHPAQQPDAV
jgi:maleylacetoacetate isomerase